MHGLVNRAIQDFLRDTYGGAVWTAIAKDAGLGFEDFEAMLTYPSDLTGRVIAASAARLNKSPEDLLEDLGTYLVSHPNVEALRRLLRFGGGNFVEFLLSLDDLPDRARLAMPDLALPRLSVTDEGAGRFTLCCAPWDLPIGRVMLGVLRAMADDYGTLAILEHQDDDGADRISIVVHETRHSAGRAFALAGPARR